MYDDRILTHEHVLYGIINKLMFYSHDPLHDLVEGVFPKYLWWVIKTYYTNSDVDGLNDKMQTIEWRNGRIQNVDRSYSKFHASSGMQFLEFFIQFGYLNSVLDRNGRIFAMYRNLRKIWCVVTSFEIKESDLINLDREVNNFIRNFTELYDGTITFKIHFMVH